MIRVLLADDQALVRGGFRMIIDDQPDMEVVAEAPDGALAVDLALRTQPHVVLMDIRMPNMDGIEATRRLTRQRPSPKVMILTTFDLDEYVYTALAAGASGFLLKDLPPAELPTAIRVLAGGDALLAPGVTRRLIEEFARSRPPAAASQRLAALSDRELEVLRLVAEGKSNTEIAATVFLGESTIKTHIGHLLAKLELRDRVQLAIYAYESRLVHPGHAADRDTRAKGEGGAPPQ
ncbi:response regulator transcription factor [Conexibacter sp. DBS9H8]|uniref:response regulator transcription factor n=1 Tax=Conexibacter sp. DBS9H8 TaxID=2937801 RepID=UPI00200EB05C|nr:response regulator transcription factor [Conexibacter sp. DBS9H8]